MSFAPMPSRALKALACILACAATAACSRAVSVQTPPTPVFAIGVENRTADELVVSYDDGSAIRALGTVLPGRTERFIIAATAVNPVDITARSADGSRIFGPYRVTLQPGTTVPLTIR